MNTDWKYVYNEGIFFIFLNVSTIVPVCLSAFNSIIKLYNKGQFYCHWKPQYLAQTIDHSEKSFNLPPFRGSSRKPILCHLNVFLMLHSTDVTDRWFTPITPVSSTYKTDRHDISELLLNAALKTITLNSLFCLYGL